MKMYNFILFITILTALLFTIPAYAQEHSDVEKIVEDILGFDVSVGNFMVIRNGGEVAFDIINDKFPKYNGISFSEDYLKRSPEVAKKDLLAMYNLKKRFPELERIALWNALFNDNEIIRYVVIGKYRVDLGDDWETIVDGEGIRIWNEKCGLEDFYLPYPSDILDKKTIEYLNDLSENPPRYEIEKLWGLDVDVFKLKGDPQWILKGGSSTIFYDPISKKFSVGGMWGKGSEIKQVIQESKMIIINDNGRDWILQIIDTKENHTCSAYRAFKEEG